MNSNFILLNKTYQTVDYINKIIMNYPKKENVLKNYIENVSYTMVEELFSFNINDSKRIKEKFLKEYMTKLSMINYLMHQSFLKKCITYKQSEHLAKVLLELKSIASAILKGLDDDSL